MKLLILESPGKVKKVQEILGSNWAESLWCIGSKSRAKTARADMIFGVAQAIPPVKIL